MFRAAEQAAGRTPHAKRGNVAQVPDELYDPPLTSKGEAEVSGGSILAPARVAHCEQIRQVDHTFFRNARQILSEREIPGARMGQGQGDIVSTHSSAS